MWIKEALASSIATVFIFTKDIERKSGLATYNKPDKPTRVSSSKSFLTIVSILRKVSQTILAQLF